MKRCNHCGRENAENATFCAGCGTPLDEDNSTKDPAPNDPSLQPARIAQYNDILTADLLKTRLEAAGIEAFVPEDNSSDAFASMIPFHHGSVWVHVKDQAAAQAIAAEFEKEIAEPQTPAEEPPEPPGSRPMPPDPEKELVAPHAADVPPPPGMTRCVSCGAMIPLDSTLCPHCGWTQPRLA